jgi:hypothetical protein
MCVYTCVCVHTCVCEREREREKERESERARERKRERERARATGIGKRSMAHSRGVPPHSAKALCFFWHFLVSFACWLHSVDPLPKTQLLSVSPSRSLALCLSAPPPAHTHKHAFPLPPSLPPSLFLSQHTWGRHCGGAGARAHRLLGVRWTRRSAALYRCRLICLARALLGSAGAAWLCVCG